jgi:hypothetical protein
MDVASRVEKCLLADCTGHSLAVSAFVGVVVALLGFFGVPLACKREQSQPAQEEKQSAASGCDETCFAC